MDTHLPAMILVVDDEPAVNRLVTRYLAHLGYGVLDATSAEEALAIVYRGAPRIDVVVSDVVMPGMGGTELAAELLSRAPGPSVILMTGQLPPEVERLHIRGQIVRVVRKPLNLDELQQLLRVTLEGYRPEDEVDAVGLVG
jgi:CheY-like chemotaxis protein